MTTRRAFVLAPTKTNSLLCDSMHFFTGSLMSHPIAHLIDHTLLKANATQKDIMRLCEEAVSYGFASVCVLPSRVSCAARFLGGTNVAVCTVIGFPLGGSSTAGKCEEARQAALDDKSSHGALPGKSFWRYQNAR